MKRTNDSYLKGRKQSFSDAFKGIPYIFRESNFKIHLIIALLTICAAFFLKFSLMEFMILILCIFFIFAMEGINTAIEYLVDFISPDYHEKAGKIKDIASASVLITAIGVSIVGLVLFGCHLY